MDSVYGIRLLRQRRVRVAGLVVVLAAIVAFRALQFAGLAGELQWGYDFSAYWDAASRLLAGEPLYDAEQLAGPYAPQRQFLYLYPPPLAAAAAPLALLFPDDYRAAAWLWAVLGAAILVAVTLAVAGAERLVDRFALLAGRGRWLLVGAALTLPPVVGELVLGNVHLLLLGLLGLAWLGIRRAETGDARGDVVAGLAVGVAAVVKVFPGLLLAWFLVTRRWRAAAFTLVGALAAVFVMLPLTGIDAWRDYPTVLANLAAPIDTTDTLAPAVWLAPLLGYTPARVIVTVAALGLLAWAALRREAAASFGGAVILSLLVAPALYHHYLAISVLPFLLALGLGRPLLPIAAAYLLLWGGAQSALGDLAWVVNRALPTAGAVVLLSVLLRPDPAPAVRATHPPS
jgi:alpha-1,2-mannosyltransferase